MASLKGVTVTLLMGPVAVSPVPEAVAAAFERAEVVQGAGPRSGFQISFVYSKTSPIATELLPGGFFDPMVRVILVATLDGVSRVLADGPIKRHDVVATTEPGANRLTVTGEDVSGYMDAIDFSGMPFPAMPPFARVALLLAKYAMFGVIPEVIPSPLSMVFSPTDKIPQQQGTDFEYIDRLAKDAGYVFYVTPGPAPGMNVAYWGPEIRIGSLQPALTVDFDQASNAASISFTADGEQSQIAYGFVKVANVSVPVPAPPVGILKPPLAARPIVPTRTRLIETERLGMPEAMGMLLSGAAAGDPLTASGTVDLARYGRPIEARSLIGVRGAGRAHDGAWYVRSVAHELARGSWRQRFQLAREGVSPQQSKVPV